MAPTTNCRKLEYKNVADPLDVKSPTSETTEIDPESFVNKAEVEDLKAKKSKLEKEKELLIFALGGRKQKLSAKTTILKKEMTW